MTTMASIFTGGPPSVFLAIQFDPMKKKRKMPFKLHLTFTILL